MVSPNKVLIPLELEGKTHQLAVDLNFYITFEKLTGINLMKGSKALEGWEPSPLEIRSMLYAALRAGGGTLSEEEVGALVHLGNLDLITDKLIEVQKANAAPEAKGAGPGNPSPPETAATPDSTG